MFLDLLPFRLSAMLFCIFDLFRGRFGFVPPKFLYILEILGDLQKMSSNLGAA
jgi:hypothetical protein